MIIADCNAQALRAQAIRVAIALLQDQLDHREDDAGMVMFRTGMIVGYAQRLVDLLGCVGMGVK